MFDFPHVLRLAFIDRIAYAYTPFSHSFGYIVTRKLASVRFVSYVTENKHGEGARLHISVLQRAWPPDRIIRLSCLHTFDGGRFIYFS